LRFSFIPVDRLLRQARVEHRAALDEGKPQFQLRFERSSPGRACKVAWKKADVIGIKFV
jgi:hypothetical protein